MSDLVERLAKDFATWSAEQGDVWDDEDAARWMLNAVADELRSECEKRRREYLTPPTFAGHFMTCFDWLRSQASSATPDTVDSGESE